MKGKRQSWSIVAICATALVIIATVVGIHLARSSMESSETGSGIATRAADATARSFKLNLDRARSRANSGWDSQTLVEQAIADGGLPVHVVSYRPADSKGDAAVTVRVDATGTTSGFGGGQNRAFEFCYVYMLSPYSVGVPDGRRLGACD